MKTKNRVFSLLFAFTLLFSILFVLPSPVMAATNGQQIQVYACSADRVIIQGINQSWNWATYTLNISSSSCGWYSISGWWWKGAVSLTPYYYVSTEYRYYQGQSVWVTVPTSSSSNWVSVTIQPPNTRQLIAWRAQTWVNDSVSYIYGGGNRDGYFQDCSGLVAFAWGLGKNVGTSRLSTTTYAYKLPSFDSMQPGDALLTGSHVMLFMGWVSQSQGTFIANEENFHYNKTVSRQYRLNKATGMIYDGNYNYNGWIFKPIRKNGL